VFFAGDRNNLDPVLLRTKGLGRDRMLVHQTGHTFSTRLLVTRGTTPGVGPAAAPSTPPSGETVPSDQRSTPWSATGAPNSPAGRWPSTELPTAASARL
jgi:hypothetical protein